ncbi:MAG: phosphate signaling complex protein PhoU [Tepidisphaerales bacterium]
MRHFEQQLQDLLKKIVLMGSIAEAMIQGAVRSLIERNESLSRDVFEKERQVDQLQLEIDEAAVTLVALNQPMAADVRFLFAASRITSEIERIGDQAINICQNARYVLQFPPLKPMVDIAIMSDIVEKMVRDVLTALVERDIALAEKVIEYEDQVDAFKDQVFRTLLTYMMADPGTIQRALSLILLSRNLERIGDHSTNIAEEVIYLVQGRDIRHPSLSADGKTGGGDNNGTLSTARTQP